MGFHFILRAWAIIFPACMSAHHLHSWCWKIEDGIRSPEMPALYPTMAPTSSLCCVSLQYILVRCAISIYAIITQQNTKGPVQYGIRLLILFPIYFTNMQLFKVLCIIFLILIIISWQDSFISVCAHTFIHISLACSWQMLNCFQVSSINKWHLHIHLSEDISVHVLRCFPVRKFLKWNRLARRHTSFKCLDTRPRISLKKWCTPNQWVVISLCNLMGAVFSLHFIEI